MTWNRLTTRVLGGLLALAAVGGCKQQLFIEPQDYTRAVTANLPANIESNPHAAIVPPTVERLGTSPATVKDPTRPPRYVTLKECIAVALEQGNIGLQSTAQFGTKSDTLSVYNGGATAATDAIRAFALDPANQAANIERSLSKFDTRWITSMQWQKNDNPVAAQFVSFQQQNDSANFSSGLYKFLPTGGLAGITFSVGYTKYASIPASQANNFINPNYQPQVQFTFEQPLMQLFGVEINQISNQSPTSLLISNLTPTGGVGVDGILVTRVRFDQAKAEFEREVNYLLVNVETAYWNLYAAYYALYAQEEGLRQSYEQYRFEKARVEIGQDLPQTLDQAVAQFELFRSGVLTARGQVLESERQLRGFLGLRSDDGYRLVPIDEPNLAPYQPDFYEAANDAITRRPELLIVRQEVKAQQLLMLLQKTLRKPDLRFYSSYNIAGLGTRLDGSETLNNEASGGGLIPGNAFTSMTANNFNSWTLGLRLTMPLGFRDANAQVRQAQLQVTRNYIQLRDMELKVLELLVQSYRQLIQTWEVIPPLRARREALQKFVARLQSRILIGQFNPSDYFNLLQVQRDLASAIQSEFAAIGQYNAAIAQFEFTKGTVQQYNNVTLAEGGLPQVIRQRAVDHEQERTKKALQLRQRPSNDPSPQSPNSPVSPVTGGDGDLPKVIDFPPPPDTGKGVPSGDPGTPPTMKPLPLPKQFPLENPGNVPGANPNAAAPPMSVPSGNSQSQALPQPTPVTGMAAEAPLSGSFFVPSGERVNIQRLSPLPSQSRGADGGAPLTGQVPPVAGSAQPTVPPLPSGGIPATIPLPGATSTPTPNIPGLGGQSVPISPMPAYPPPN